ncbi:exopolysaccharide biosynthesis polyprenyl glycosylphosphotransferase [Clostridiales bacterium 1_7_47FAA]|uniref:Sugar transferase n=1 Tax=Enterocloster hominis (ex Hitch et al. 2024) TaxID=1917870 RepID=A0ABV1CZL3_9FIRM|nr:sugar transferase [Lachnoclostridium pacaense]EEQ58027.1 exopolysaccharide biosynthesis polyprenyl glycosylphosphotransferase [Clostridiales bacterium 1_7_47FAA]
MKNARTKHLDFIIGDMVALGLAQFLMVLLNQDKLNPVLYVYYVQLGLLLVIITLSVAFLTDGYRNILHRGYLKEIIAVIHQMTIIFATEVICLFSFRLVGLFSRLVLFATFFVGILFMYAERLMIKNCLRRKFQNIKYARTIMVIATEQQAGILIRQLSSRILTIFKIQGVAITDRDMKGQTIQGVPVSCSMDGLSEYITGHIIDEILLSIPDDPRQEAELAKQFLSIGMVVHIYMEQFLQDIPRKTLERVSNMNVITCFNREIPMRRLFCKRLLDILGGAVGCVMTLVIGLMIGPMIFFKSPGPVLFSQIRVGKNGRKFRIYKFRSMVMDADEQKEMLMSRNKIRGNMFKMDDDPRIIPGIGHFIRRTSLDEFPQFFNVLRGDMSLVGTRPPTVDEYEAYSFSHKKRLAMKPGITGLWQISGRSDITDFEEVVKLDGQYIDQWDLEMDVKIIFKTILVILKRRGSV